MDGWTMRLSLSPHEAMEALLLQTLTPPLPLRQDRQSSSGVYMRERERER